MKKKKTKYYLFAYPFVLLSMAFLLSFSTVKNSYVKYDFAFNLGASYNTQLVSFSVIGTRNGKIIYKKNISESSFIRQISGTELSKANPEKINYFEKYELTDCFYKYDSIKDIYVDGYNCFRLTDLWALKYGRNPHCSGDCIPAEGMLVKGWAAQNFRPSWSQIQILQNYGIINIDDTFYGEKMFQLFSDMKDSNWISTYSNAGKQKPNRTKG